MKEIYPNDNRKIGRRGLFRLFGGAAASVLLSACTNNLEPDESKRPPAAPKSSTKPSNKTVDSVTEASLPEIGKAAIAENTTTPEEFAAVQKMAENLASTVIEAYNDGKGNAPGHPNYFAIHEPYGNGATYTVNIAPNDDPSGGTGYASVELILGVSGLPVNPDEVLKPENVQDIIVTQFDSSGEPVSETSLHRLPGQEVWSAQYEGPEEELFLSDNSSLFTNTEATALAALDGAL